MKSKFQNIYFEIYIFKININWLINISAQTQETIRLMMKYLWKALSSPSVIVQNQKSGCVVRARCEITLHNMWRKWNGRNSLKRRGSSWNYSLVHWYMLWGTFDFFNCVILRVKERIWWMGANTLKYFCDKKDCAL